MRSPIRLKKVNLSEATRELELLSEKLETAQTPERFRIIKQMRDEVYYAGMRYLRTRIRCLGEEPWPNWYYGACFPYGLLIRMSAEEGMVESKENDIIILGLGYRSTTAYPEIIMRCIQEGGVVEMPITKLTDKGVAYLIQVMSIIKKSRKRTSKELTFKYFTWI